MITRINSFIFYRLTVLALIIESHWTSSSNKLYIDNFENNSSCISNDEYEIISECHPCTAFEIASESIGVCIHARYKEVLKCKSGETITRRYIYIYIYKAH